MEIKKENLCKYCGEPTTGYCCRSCFKLFECPKINEEDYCEEKEEEKDE